MSDTVFRIIGPSNNRLLTVLDAERLLPGQIDRVTAEILLQHDWAVYSGPGKSVKGWLIAGSDPNHEPRPLNRSKRS